MENNDANTQVEQNPSTPPTIDFEAEYNKLKTENEKLRQANTNASSDAASWKKKFRETQTEQERLAAEQADAVSAMKTEIEGYKQRERISNYKAKLMESGYSAEAADTMSKALPDGISDDFFTAQKTFIENAKATERANALKQQPGITPGAAPTGESFEDKQVAAFRRGALGW